MRFWKLIIGLCVVLAVAGCARLSVQQQLIKDTASVDSTYIATLIFLEVGKQHETELAFDRFKQRWTDYYKKYYGLELKYGQNIVDKYWQEDFDHINNLFISAEASIKAQKLAGAKAQLDPIKLVFRDLRRRHGTVYYLDALADYQRTVNDLSRPLHGQTKLKEREVVDLRELFAAAQKSLTGLSQTKIDRRYFKLSSKQQQSIAERLKNEEKLLGRVAAAITTRDVPAIGAAIEALKPDLIMIYRGFGDCQTIIDQVTKEKIERQKRTTTTTLQPKTQKHKMTKKRHR